MHDIVLAASKGIDAFALNVGRDPSQFDRIHDAYSAALESGSNFKLFLSLDMTSLDCSDESHMEPIHRFVFPCANHPSQLLYQGKPLVSTFSGERCTFGQGDPNAGWLATLKNPSFVHDFDYADVYFIPSFFVSPRDFDRFTVIDGMFNWNSGWPVGDSDIDFNSDQDYISNLGSKSYIPAVSPWFFTHYGPDSYNKNWIYKGDNWLLSSRWEMLKDNRDAFDLVEIISWNDFGESHYLSYRGDKPNCQSWTDGFDHLGWLDLMQYYIQAFKTGRNPVPTRDRLFLWARLYPANAITEDRVGKPMNWESTKDILWAVCAAESPAEVTLTCSPSQSTSQVFAGLTKLSLPLTTNCQVQASLARDGLTVVDVRPDNFKFSTQPTIYNYNAFVYATS
ncbi:glycoside hydrolase family 71 protein [Flagelloscypha sp. PMI_526]|nr:glycoside hydrolase family 71 protein [Flagelloscypha sp. PMI_526]